MTVLDNSFSANRVYVSLGYSEFQKAYRATLFKSPPPSRGSALSSSFLDTGWMTILSRFLEDVIGLLVNLSKMWTLIRVTYSVVVVVVQFDSV